MFVQIYDKVHGIIYMKWRLKWRIKIVHKIQWGGSKNWCKNCRGSSNKKDAQKESWFLFFCLTVQIKTDVGRAPPNICDILKQIKDDSRLCIRLSLTIVKRTAAVLVSQSEHTAMCQTRAALWLATER